MLELYQCLFKIFIMLNSISSKRTKNARESFPLKNQYMMDSTRGEPWQLSQARCPSTCFTYISVHKDSSLYSVPSTETFLHTPTHADTKKIISQIFLSLSLENNEPLSVTRLGNLLHFGQLFKHCDSNYFAQLAHIFREFLKVSKC